MNILFEEDNKRINNKTLSIKTISSPDQPQINSFKTMKSSKINSSSIKVSDTALVNVTLVQAYENKSKKNKKKVKFIKNLVEIVYIENISNVYPSFRAKLKKDPSNSINDLHNINNHKEPNICTSCCNTF